MITHNMEKLMRRRTDFPRYMSAWRPKTKISRRMCEKLGVRFRKLQDRWHPSTSNLQTGSEISPLEYFHPHILSPYI